MKFLNLSFLAISSSSTFVLPSIYLNKLLLKTLVRI